jgi:ribosomal protein S18 acetylase RimI-like enzyme
VSHRSADVHIRHAGPGDEGEVARFDDAFDNDVRADQTGSFLADPRHHLLLGYVGDRPAGFVSAVEVFHPDKPPELFLNEIAVVSEAQRRGVATALIEELKRIARQRGCVNMWVLTDQHNEAAKNLYRRTGGRVADDPSLMFEYDLTTP